MKKTVTSLIALALTASMGTTTFADTITSKDGSSSTPISATYSATTPTPDTVISVDVAWGSMEFTYKNNDTKVWNPDDHKYVVTPQDATWSCETDANKITVTNHSNAAVKASLTYTEKNGSKITGSFKNANLSLASAEGTAQGAAPKADATLTVEGQLAETATTKATIGSVTVTISEVVSTFSLGGNTVEKANLYATDKEGVYKSNTIKANIDVWLISGPSCEIIIDGKSYYIGGQIRSEFTTVNLITTPNNYSTINMAGSDFYFLVDIENMTFSTVAA